MIENIEKLGAEPDPASLSVEINAATRDRDTAAKLRHPVRLKKFVEVAIVGALGNYARHADVGRHGGSSVCEGARLVEGGTTISSNGSLRTRPVGFR
jgi:hypothetical protein